MTTCNFGGLGVSSKRNNVILQSDNKKKKRRGLKELADPTNVKTRSFCCIRALDTNKEIKNQLKMKIPVDSSSISYLDNLNLKIPRNCLSLENWLNCRVHITSNNINKKATEYKKETKVLRAPKKKLDYNVDLELMNFQENNMQKKSSKLRTSTTTKKSLASVVKQQRKMGIDPKNKLHCVVHLKRMNFQKNNITNEYENKTKMDCAVHLVQQNFQKNQVPIISNKVAEKGSTSNNKSTEHRNQTKMGNLNCKVHLAQMDIHQTTTQKISNISTAASNSSTSNKIFQKSVLKRTQNRKYNKSGIISKSPNIRMLRKRKTRNYAELSLVQTPELQPPPAIENKHVPVYLKEVAVNDLEIPDPVQDLYEFKSTSPAHDKQTNKKRRQKQKKTKSRFPKYNERIQKIMSAVRKKANLVNKSNTDKTTLLEGGKNVRKNKVESQQIRASSIKDNNDLPFENTFRGENNNLSVLKGTELEYSVGTDGFYDDDHRDDSFDYFEHPSSSHEQNAVPVVTQNTSNRVNIISNVLISPGIKANTNNTSTDFDKIANGGSTTVKTIRRPIASPWRVNLARVPLLLRLKDSSLPSFNQEPVMNASIENSFMQSPAGAVVIANTEKYFMPSSAGRKSNIDESKSILQSSMLSYVSTDSLLANDQTDHSACLFNESEFSPLKNKNKQQFNKDKLVTIKHNILNKENSITSPLRTGGKSNRIPFRCIQSTPLANNQNIMLSPNASVITPENSDDEINNYFGFDSVNTDDKENVVLRNTPKKIKPANKNAQVSVKKPTRISHNQVKTLLVDDGKGLEKNTVIDEDSNLDELDVFPSPVSEVDGAAPHLFEDVEMSDNKFLKNCYARKKPKRYYQALEEDDEAPRKKRVDLRSKSEEEEAEKWATAFNAMCHEVENHSLAIE